MGKELLMLASALICSHLVILYNMLLCRCMVDSKTSAQSKFYPSDYKTMLRFSVGALMFKDMSSTPEDKIVNIIHINSMQ